MKNKTTKYLTVRTIPISNGKILGNIDTPNTLIHNHSLSWLGTGTSIKKVK
jgi:hypothetical protein